MAPAVSLRAAVAVTGRFPALAGVDLTVDEGESVVLTGPNGAGKTSLLRVCAGLLKLASGEALVLGHDLTEDASAVRRHVALLGHASALYDDLSVAENVRFAVRAAGGDARRVDPALERLGLVGRLRNTSVSRLSAGQRKRVALAVVVARRPSLWLLDEPHASLDAAARSILASIITQATSEGATVIATSHETDAASAISARIVSLAGGRVTADLSREDRGREDGSREGRGREDGSREGRGREDRSDDHVVVSLRDGAHVA